MNAISSTMAKDKNAVVRMNTSPYECRFSLRARSAVAQRGLHASAGKSLKMIAQYIARMRKRYVRNPSGPVAKFAHFQPSIRPFSRKIPPILLNALMNAAFNPKSNAKNWPAERRKSLYPEISAAFLRKEGAGSTPAPFGIPAPDWRKPSASLRCLG